MQFRFTPCLFQFPPGLLEIAGFISKPGSRFSRLFPPYPTYWLPHPYQRPYPQLSPLRPPTHISSYRDALQAAKSIHFSTCSGRLPSLSVQLFHYQTLWLRSKVKVQIWGETALGLEVCTIQPGESLFPAQGCYYLMRMVLKPEPQIK